MNSICVFSGLVPGHGDDYLIAARSVGNLLAKKNITLIYGGGTLGVSGAVANATLGAGGRAVGILPRPLWDVEAGHRALSDLLLVDSIQDRLTRMAEMADAFLVLPGGAGVLADCFAVWRLCPPGPRAKPFGFLDIGGLWRRLLGALDDLVESGFLRSDQRGQLVVSDDPEALLAALLPS